MIYCKVLKTVIARYKFCEPNFRYTHLQNPSQSVYCSGFEINSKNCQQLGHCLLCNDFKQRYSEINKVTCMYAFAIITGVGLVY